MALLGVMLVLAATATGIALGVVASFRRFGHARGFYQGATVGCLFTLITSLMCGELLAGVAEGWWGMTLGVPLGSGVGCIVAAYAGNTIAGAVGVLLARMWTELR